MNQPAILLALIAAALTAACRPVDPAKSSDRSEDSGTVDGPGPVADPGMGPKPTGPPPAPTSPVPAPAPAPGPDLGFDPGTPPELISGTNLVGYDNARARCDVREVSPGRYSVYCNVTALQPDGKELRATKIVDGTSLAWKDPVTLFGTLTQSACTAAADALSQICDVQTQTPASSAKLRYDLEVKRDASPARTESALVLLPFSVAVLGGLVPSIPFQYRAVAADTKPDAELGRSAVAIAPADLRPDGFDAIAGCGATALLGGGQSTYRFEGGLFRLFAGSTVVGQEMSLAHRFRARLGAALHIACFDGGAWIYDEIYARLLRVPNGDGPLAAFDIPGQIKSLTAAPDGTVFYTAWPQLFRRGADGVETELAAGLGTGAMVARVNDGTLFVLDGGKIKKLGDAGALTEVADSGGSERGFVNTGGGLYVIGGPMGAGVRRFDPANNSLTTVAAIADFGSSGYFTGYARVADGIELAVVRVTGAVHLYQRTNGGTAELIAKSAPQSAPGACGTQDAKTGWVRAPLALSARADGRVDALDEFLSTAFVRTLPALGGTSIVDHAGSCAAARVAGAKKPSGLARHPSGYLVTILDGVAKRLNDDGTMVDLGYGNGAGAALTIDAMGRLYVAEGSANKVTRRDPDGQVTTMADLLTDPRGVMLAKDGALWIGERGRIRRVAPGGMIATVAGTGATTSTGDGGAALSATLKSATSLVEASDGSIYFIDFDGSRLTNRVRRLVPTAAGAYKIEGVFGGGTDGTDCATGVVQGEAAAGDVAAKIRTSLGVMCQAVPLSLALQESCGAGGTGRRRLYVGQAFQTPVYAESNGHVIEIDEPCP